MCEIETDEGKEEKKLKNKKRLLKLRCEIRQNTRGMRQIYGNRRQKRINNNVPISILKPIRCAVSQLYFILEKHSTCFGQSLRPSSGV